MSGRGRRSRLTSPEWVYLAATLMPVLVLDLLAKVQRVRRLGAAHGFLEHLDQLRSEVLVGGGVVVLWAALFGRVQSRAGRGVALMALHLFALVALSLILVSHVFFMTTGMPLDLGTIVTGLRSADEIAGLLGAIVTPAMWVVLGTALLGVVLMPAVMSRRWFSTFTPLLGDAEAHGPLRRPVALAVGLVLTAVGCLPTMTVGSSFGREAVVSLLAQQGTATSLPRPEGYVAPTPSDLPTGTYLVPVGSGQHKNLVVIALESTRYSATTLGNPDLLTTPHLAELARTSTVATRAYSVVPHTSKALVAMHCGVTPPLDSSNSEAMPRGVAARCFPDLLEAQGYRTAFFQAATAEFERRGDLVGQMGFDEFVPLESMRTKGFGKVNYFGYEDDIMLAPIRAWTHEHRDKPFALSVLTVATHHDYVVPKGWAKQSLAKDPVFNDYLNLVRYEDAFVHRLIDQFKEQGLYDSTIFVILGDHGEGFGEHQRWQHDATIYEEGLHIPLVIHDGSAPVGRVLADPVDNTSVLPTVIDMLGYRIRNGTYDAPSLLDPQPRRPVVAGCYRPNQCAALIDGSIKYIHHFGLIPDEIFDLARDPLERRNVIDHWDREDIARMKGEVAAWIHRNEDLYRIRRSG